MPDFLLGVFTLLIRSRLFLTFLAVCLLPLLLLVGVNYLMMGRTAVNKIKIDQQSELADFKSEVSRLITQDQNELLKLGQARVLHNYLLANTAEKTALPVDPQPKPPVIGSEADPSTAIPADVRLKIASVLNNRSHFSGLSLFDQTQRQIFFAAQHSNADDSLTFRTSYFLAEEVQPDSQVWTASPLTVLTSALSERPEGARIVLTVPVFEKQNPQTRNGALVGELKIDSILSEAIKGQRPPAGASASSKSAASQFIVIDRALKILSHSNEGLKYQPVGDSIPYFLPVANQMIASNEGSQDFTAANGETFSASYTRIPTLDLSVAVASNRDLALAPARRAGLIGLVVAIPLAIIAAVFLTRERRRKSRGIERVTKGVEAIAEGRLDHSIGMLSSDDLRPLAENIGLVTQQLRDQLAREAETRQFESFVRLSAVLTHDLKNAIEALSLTVSNMERHFDNPEFRIDAMKTLKGATENLKSLVTRLSTPVNTLSGEHKLPRRADLVPMLKRVTTMIAKPAQVEHEIQVRLPESLFALVDIERLDKVVENLIINALESMSAAKGTLVIEAGKTADAKPFFSVSDTGEGMTQRFIEENLFHPFATTKRRGVGLGLYTCREVVRANGGSIEVESAKGAGTTFRVVLPSAENENRSEKKQR